MKKSTLYLLAAGAVLFLLNKKSSGMRGLGYSNAEIAQACYDYNYEMSKPEEKRDQSVLRQAGWLLQMAQATGCITGASEQTGGGSGAASGGYTSGDVVGPSLISPSFTSNLDQGVPTLPYKSQIKARVKELVKLRKALKKHRHELRKVANREPEYSNLAVDINMIAAQIKSLKKQYKHALKG